MEGPILVASDGGRGSEGAIRVGLGVARGTGRAVEVVAVLRPFARHGAPGLAPFPEGYALYETMLAESLREAVSRQLGGVAEEAAAWPVAVETGTPAHAIVRHARAMGAALVVVGMGEHAPLDRWLGDETALGVTRLASTPVLAVPRTASGLPTRALVAVDFSEFSLRAARAVPTVLGPGSHVVLVHLTGPAEVAAPVPGLAAWRRTYRRDAEARLDEIASELRAERPLEVEYMVAAGDPAEELLGLAARLNVDVIAAGSHGYGFLGRLVMGSVSTRLVRGASCSVLIAPPESPPQEVMPAPDARGEEARPSGSAATVEAAPPA